MKIAFSWRYGVAGIYHDRDHPIWHFYVPFVRLTVGSPPRHFQEEIFCGRCGTTELPVCVDSVAVTHWKPDPEVGGWGVATEEIINNFCLPCWKLIVSAIPPHRIS